jgi:non-haem Fe2+, alpha-ketoglutarate-dependent halogenase
VRLSEHQLDAYHRDGFVFPIPVLSTAEVEAARRSLDEVLTRCGAPAQRIPSTHAYFRWAYNLAAHPRILDAVESILGPDILVWGTLILSKPAHTRYIVPWHQDGAYAAYLNGAGAVSAWIALTPVNSENGCMRFLPGSFGRLLPFTEEPDPHSMIKRGQRVLAEIDETKAVDQQLAPGEASLHEVTLVHGSHANTSDAPRTGFIVRYTTPAMRQTKHPLFCVRGTPRNIVVSHAPPAADPEEHYLAYAEFLRSELAKSPAD